RQRPRRSPLFPYTTLFRSFFEAYRFIVPGYNVRPIEMAAAVGLEQLKKFDRMLAIRRANGARFVEMFRGDDRIVIQRENGESSRSEEHTSELQSHLNLVCR